MTRRGENFPPGYVPPRLLVRRGVRKMRPCLAPDTEFHEFLSNGPGDRICKPCKTKARRQAEKGHTISRMAADPPKLILDGQ